MAFAWKVVKVVFSYYVYFAESRSYILLDKTGVDIRLFRRNKLV